MKLSYKVTKEQYADLIAMTMKNRTMKPAQIALTAVMCGLPVILVIFMLCTGALADMNMLLMSAEGETLTAEKLDETLSRFPEDALIGAAGMTV